MWIQPAFAQTAPSPGGDVFGFLIPMILMLGILYLLIIRPQQKRQKQHQAKLSAVKRGDKVITGGGIYGTVRRVGDEGRIMVEIAKDVQIEVELGTLADVLLKSDPQPAKETKATSGGLLAGLFGSKNNKTEQAADESAANAEEKPSKKPKTKKKNATKTKTSDKKHEETPAEMTSEDNAQ